VTACLTGRVCVSVMVLGLGLRFFFVRFRFGLVLG
jgi:hypothetical protein